MVVAPVPRSGIATTTVVPAVGGFPLDQTLRRTTMTIIVVGAGLAGGTAVTELRERGYDGRLVLIGSETHPPYERPPLSKGYLLGNDPIDDAFVHDAAWYAEQDVELRLATTVTAVDPTRQEITAGGETLA